MRSKLILACQDSERKCGVGIGASISRIGRLCNRYRYKAPGFKNPRAYINWFRSNYEMMRQTSRIRSRPLKLTIDTVNSCQLRCPLCPTGLQVHDRKVGIMDIQQFSDLMKEVGDYLFIIDFYNWGEPLLNKHIDDFIKLANSYRISTELSTNLSFKLDDERIREIVESGLNEIIVSIDGATQESYGQYRRRGDIELVLDNMRRIIAMKHKLNSDTPIMTWRFLVFAFNEHEVEMAREMANDIGINKFIATSAYLDEGYYPVPDHEKELMKDWNPVTPEYRLYDRRENGVFISKRKQLPVASRCDWHYMSAAINSDGGVAPCCVLYKKEDDFGVLGKDSAPGFMDIMNNEKFVAIRDFFAGKRKEPANLVCERCPATNIMGYARGVNRDILMMTINIVIVRLQRLFH